VFYEECLSRDFAKIVIWKQNSCHDVVHNYEFLDRGIRLRRKYPVMNSAILIFHVRQARSVAHFLCHSWILCLQLSTFAARREADLGVHRGNSSGKIDSKSLRALNIGSPEIRIGQATSLAPAPQVTLGLSDDLEKSHPSSRLGKCESSGNSRVIGRLSGKHHFMG
jgi:hypothetical protein